MNVVILAAGQGTRMRSDLPKVLHRLAGRPLLEHVIAGARRLAPKGIVVVYGHGGDAVRESFADAGLTWIRQAPQLGTGHALLRTLPALDYSVSTLVLYGDVPLTRHATLEKLIDAAGDGIGLLTVELDDPSGYGRIIRRGAEVARIVEQKDATAEERAIREVNTGLMVLPTSQLAGWLARLGNDNAQREYYLTDVVALAVGDGVPVRAVHPSDAWETLGVNSKADLAALERVLQREVAARLLEEGVTLADPQRVDIRGELACGHDVAIDVNCVFEGRVELGDGVQIGAHCVLRDVRLAAGTRVEPFCHIVDADIGRNCRIGPYARIRPATRLADDVHIGNFVEVKASEVGAGSKANHLSYIGDSSVGRNVNVGAGTITCNYDGASKHRTIIEDDAFIGSDTQLVAPVRVGRGATLGAGTILVKDAPEGELTVSRAKQVTVRGWKRPQKKK
jgi:bifunctional UDP-N-acetylglucosamine pyrophosphorylase/glucosamine-1-phosphate N-acetyltransferase